MGTLGTNESPVSGGLYISEMGRLVNSEGNPLLDEVLATMPLDDAERMMKYSGKTLDPIDKDRLQAVIDAKSPKQAEEEKPEPKPRSTRKAKSSAASSSGDAE